MQKEQKITGICEICGRNIILTAFDVCYQCREQRLGEIQRVLDFIKEHRNSNIAVVAEATGVEASLVLKMMQRGSLMVRKPSEAVSKARLSKKR
jgi:hypothetical protein